VQKEAKLRKCFDTGSPICKPTGNYLNAKVAASIMTMNRKRKFFAGRPKNEIFT
jgi:hypothetical protein